MRHVTRLHLWRTVCIMKSIGNMCTKVCLTRMAQYGFLNESPATCNNNNTFVYQKKRLEELNCVTLKGNIKHMVLKSMKKRISSRF